MSMQTPTGFKDGAWEINGAQVITTLGPTPWILNAMDIAYLQMQHDANFTILWLKARAVEQPYQVGRYQRNVYSFANALSNYATKYGIPVYNSQIGGSAPQQTQPQQSGYAPQPGYAPQQGYPQQPGFAPQQGYPQQPAMNRSQERPAGRPNTGRKRKGNTKLVFLGLFLIMISVFIASSAADKGASFPLILIGIILLFVGGKSGQRRGRAGSYHGNQYYDQTTHSNGFVDRDNDGIDDRYDSFVDADGDGVDDNDDGDGGGNDD